MLQKDAVHLCKCVKDVAVNLASTCAIQSWIDVADHHMEKGGCAPLLMQGTEGELTGQYICAYAYAKAYGTGQCQVLENGRLC